MSTTPEQQDFCCAVVEDNDEYTMLNLHRVLHDYRAKVEKLEAEIAGLDPNITFQSRGIGADWTPGCFVCGGANDLRSNIAAFVRSKTDGEAVVAMFQSGARLDWRESEPRWIQVKIGACAEHVAILENLATTTVDAGGQINRRIVLAALPKGPVS